MLQKNIAKLLKSEVQVEITSPWEDLASKWDANLQRLIAETELPGFRKGTAPAAMVEQSLGSKLADEFLKVVMPQLLVEALQGTTIVPIDYPRYNLVSFAKGQPLVFKAIVTSRPEVVMGDYKNLVVAKPEPKTVTEEDVNKIVEDLFKRWQARGGAVAQATPQPQSGDSTSGSISFGASSNPAPSAPSAPSISPDDNFAKSLGAADLNDLTSKIRADLENEAKFNSEMDFEEALLSKIETITKVDVPDILVQDELNRMLVSLQRRVTDMGMLVDDYLKSQNETVESMKNRWKPQAEKNVRMELGLAEIGKLENVDVTDNEVQAEIDKVQDPRVKAQLQTQEPRLRLKHDLRQMKTLDLLKSLTKPA